MSIILCLGLSLLKSMTDVKLCLQDQSGLISTVYFESYVKAYYQQCYSSINSTLYNISMYII